MSSHCGRYPGCGCSSQIGTKCHLPDGDPRLGQKEPEFSEDVERAKRLDGENYFPDDKQKKLRFKSTNYTAKKKKRKKVKHHRN